MRARLQAILILVVVFLIGCISGGGGVYAWLNKAGASDANRSDYKGRRAQLEKSLQLSEQQTGQFEKIMDESRGKFIAARQESTAQFDSIRKEMRERIRAILTEEQSLRFDVFLKERDQQRKKHWDSHK